MHAALIETKSRSSSSQVERLVYLHKAYRASEKNSRSAWRNSDLDLVAARRPDAALAATIILPTAHQPAAHENQR